MATLTISNLDDTVLTRLADEAKRNNRSLEHEIRALLDQAARSTVTNAELRRAADRIAAKIPRDVVQTDSVVLLREDRDR